MALKNLAVTPASVRNHAMNGRSTKSFLDEGRWAKHVAEVRAGDWVIIQFGHNDEKQDKPAVYADAATSYRENLRRFVREVRAQGGQPVLATPVARRKFDADGKLKATHGDYPAAVRAVATEEGAPLLDLERATAAVLARLGAEESKRLFMGVPAGALAKIAEARMDDTHLVELGAMAVAELAAKVRRSEVKWARIWPRKSEGARAAAEGRDARGYAGAGGVCLRGSGRAGRPRPQRQGGSQIKLLLRAAAAFAAGEGKRTGAEQGGVGAGLGDGAGGEV